VILVVVVYLYAHYAFAGMTSHVVALYSAFLSIAVAAGAPPLLSALLLCFFSNLNASLTYYGDGASPIYYQSGYIEDRIWCRPDSFSPCSTWQSGWESDFRGGKPSVSGSRPDPGKGIIPPAILIGKAARSMPGLCVAQILPYLPAGIWSQEA